MGKCIDCFKEYKSSRVDKEKEINQRFYLKHKDIIKASSISRYKNTDKIQMRLYKKNYMKKYRKNSQVKILQSLRARLNQALNGKRKELPTIKLLGCTVEDLKLYLSSKFQPGMAWDNYGRGGWEVDHIKPCSKFDLSKVEEQIICFHYTNLQPLWKIDNLIKHNH